MTVQRTAPASAATSGRPPARPQRLAHRVQREYRVFVVSDATGELDKARHDMALATLGFGFGAVVDSDAVTAAWSTSA